MDIYVVNDTKTKTKKIGNTKDGIVVPRIGEQVFLGYNPPPVVTSVLYIYEENRVYVAINSPFLIS